MAIKQNPAERLRDEDTYGTATGTAILDEFSGCIVALGARGLKGFDWTQEDLLSSTSNLRRRQFEPEKGLPFRLPFHTYGSPFKDLR